MSLKKSVLSALLILSSLSSTAAFADRFEDRRPGPCDRRDPWCDSRGRDDRRDRLDLQVEMQVRRYFDMRSSLDLLLDSYTRSQLLGRRISEVRVSMAEESGRGLSMVLVNGRQSDTSQYVSREIREYRFKVDPFTSEVGRSLRSLSLETQGRFYVDRVVFVLSENTGPVDPFPRPSQTEVVRTQINQVIEREGGINLFRQLPLLERQGKTVKRVNVVATSRFGMGSVMLLKNAETFGETQVVSQSGSRITFELRGGERIGRELESLRLQFNGSINVLEVSVELEDGTSSQGPWGQDQGQWGSQTPTRPGDVITPADPRDPRIPRR